MTARAWAARRIACRPIPIVPGSNVDGKTNFADLTSMPMRSIITAPANGARVAAGTRMVADPRRSLGRR